MNPIRVLFHLARADFLERVRRYSFLVMLGLVVWLGYLSASQQFRMRVPPDYIGAVNSAWVGATMTLTVTLFLGWFGFYLIKGSVERDYTTGVGQIMATTPLTRPLYAFGKWLSNFSVLGVMILILMVAGILMNLWVGTSTFDLGALISPLIWIALPCMAVVAALAVLFETIPWLRGGLGNIVYFFLFMFLMITDIESEAFQPLLDIFGFRLIGDSVMRAAQAAYPEIGEGFAFSITPLENPNIFVWNGLDWNASSLLPRLAIFLFALVVTLAAAACFDRFNPSRLLSTHKKALKTPAASALVRKRSFDRLGERIDKTLSTLVRGRVKDRSRRTQAAAGGFDFLGLFNAELSLFLKGQPWWWYAVALGLLLGQLFSPLETTRILLVVAWVWPILLLSALGCREARHNTAQIVFSSPRPLTNQLPAAWLAAASVLAALGSGALLQFVVAAEWISVLGWVTGVVFIPSLALAPGVMTGSGKTFEIVYLVWMYLLLQNVRPLDFLAFTPHSPWAFYLPVALLLIGLTFFVRRRQLTSRNTSR